MKCPGSKLILTTMIERVIIIIYYSTDCIIVTVSLLTNASRVALDDSFHPDDHFPASPTLRQELPSSSYLNEFTQKKNMILSLSSNENYLCT